MDVRKDRFHSQALSILEEVADSHFVAFDLEFSGIPARKSRAHKPSLEEYYQDLKEAVDQYQVLQIGLTIVKQDPKNGCYTARPYNFNISPLVPLRERYFRRTWSMNSGACSFLLRNGFDFGAQIAQGIPYLSRTEEEQARRAMSEDEQRREDMDLKPEDQPLIRHIRDSIAAWQGPSKEEQDPYLNIPNLSSTEDIPTELNAYQRRLTHQTVQNEFPSLKTQSMGHFVQITNPTSEQQANLRDTMAEQREKEISWAIGFRWMWEGIMGRELTKVPDDYVLPVPWRLRATADGDNSAESYRRRLSRKLRDRRKVLVGHNCITDLMFIYRMIVGDLPTNVQQFSDSLHDMFPAIVDTKYLASCYSEKHGRNSLGEVELELRNDSHPLVELSPEFDRYAHGTYYHEAGYDSYITSIVAIKLAAKLNTEGSARRAKQAKQQKEQVAKVAQSEPLDFGIEDEYLTATESIVEDNSPGRRSSLSPLKHPLTTIKSFFTGKDNAVEKHTDTARASGESEVEKTGNQLCSFTIESSSRNSQSEQAQGFYHAATTNSTITKDSTSPTDAEEVEEHVKMPGEESSVSSFGSSSKVQPKPSDAEIAAGLAQLIQQGRMMPQWQGKGQGAFWEVYGNRIQVNGSVEGSLKIT